MGDSSRDDIRRLLKTFGIRAHEAIVAHLAQNPSSRPLRIRLTLEDLTDYEDVLPSEPLHLEIEGDVQR